MFPVLGLSSFKLSPIDSNRELPICRILWVLSERIAPFLSRNFLVDGDCMSFSTIFALLFGVLGRLHLAFCMALFSVEVDGNIFSDSLAFCKGSFNLRCHDFIFKHACFFCCALSLSLLNYALCLNLFSLFSAAIFVDWVVLVCSGCKFFSFFFFLISCIWSFCFSLTFCASLRFFAGILSFSFSSSFVLIFLFLCMPDISLGLALAFLFASFFLSVFIFFTFHVNWLQILLL